MAGFGVANYSGRVPCPYCGTVDCAGIRTTPTGRLSLICSKTGKRVTYKQLVESAIAHGLTPKPEEVAA